MADTLVSAFFYLHFAPPLGVGMGARLPTCRCMASALR